MSALECPNCIRMVYFKEDGGCPSCGKSRFVLPGKSREVILLDEERDEMKFQITYYRKRGPQVLIGGLLLAGGATAVSLFTTVYGFGLLWYGGVIVGIVMIMKGGSQIRTGRLIQSIYHETFGEKL